MLIPATFSTPEPPVPVTDPQLKEYITELRRRIEIQNIQLETIAAAATALKSA